MSSCATVPIVLRTDAILILDRRHGVQTGRNLLPRALYDSSHRRFGAEGMACSDLRQRSALIPA